MIQDKAIDVDALLCLDIQEARQVLPVNFAVVSFLPSAAVFSLLPGVEIAHIGVAAQFAHLVQIQVTDAIDKFLLRKIAIDNRMYFVV